MSQEQVAMIGAMSIEGVGISAIGRLLHVSGSSVLRKLCWLKAQVQKPESKERDQEYEVDELCTFTGHKKNHCWVIYAVNRVTKQTIDFSIGRRTTKNIKRVIDALLALHPKRIFTDKLNIYPGLIPEKTHVVSPHKINHIERRNLDLRKDLKCLSRKTICYSKSERMLEAKLTLYFWGDYRNAMIRAYSNQ